MKAELKEAFRIYDKNSNGYITTDQLREIISELDTRLTPEDLDGIIDEIDEDGSGKHSVHTHATTHLFTTNFLLFRHHGFWRVLCHDDEQIILSGGLKQAGAITMTMYITSKVFQDFVSDKPLIQRNCCMTWKGWEKYRCKTRIILYSFVSLLISLYLGPTWFSKKNPM